MTGKQTKISKYQDIYFKIKSEMSFDLLTDLGEQMTGDVSK